MPLLVGTDHTKTRKNALLFNNHINCVFPGPVIWAGKEFTLLQISRRPSCKARVGLKQCEWVVEFGVQEKRCETQHDVREIFGGSPRLLGLWHRAESSDDDWSRNNRCRLWLWAAKTAIPFLRFSLLTKPNRNTKAHERKRKALSKLTYSTTDLSNLSDPNFSSESLFRQLNADWSEKQRLTNGSRMH